MPESSFFTSPPDEAFQSWWNSAFQDFSRELGPRISKRKTQELLGSFLNKQEGSQEALENVFESFPGSAKDKAFTLLNKYKEGFSPSTESRSKFPQQIAAESNIFLTPDIGTEHLSESADKLLVDWLGVKNIENKTMGFAPLGEETFLGTRSYTAPSRTGGKLVDANRESPDNSKHFYQELSRAGVTPKEQETINSYLKYDPNIRSKGGKFKPSATKLIDNAIQKITNADTWASFAERDLPLFRGVVSTDPKTPTVGETFTTDRPTSWTPVYGVGKAFAQGASQRERDIQNQENLQRRLYVVTDYSDEARNKLLIPGFESEVIAPSKSKFEITGIGTLREELGSPDASDMQLIKLKQLYGLDPTGAAIQGGRDLLRRNATGAAIGASTSLLNPDVAKAVEKNNYGEAASTLAKDVVGGAAVEAGLRAAAPTAARVAPRVVQAIAPLARVAGPVAVGAALFNQGRTGSLTDVATRKAANVIPGLKPNPRTDVGRMAGNELMYMFNQLRGGRVPYTGR